MFTHLHRAFLHSAALQFPKLLENPVGMFPGRLKLIGKRGKNLKSDVQQTHVSVVVWGAHTFGHTVYFQFIQTL